jgi:hypothetical protein
LSITFRFSNSILIPDSVNLRDNSEESHPYSYYNQALIRAGYVNVEVAMYTGLSMSEVELIGIISDNYTSITYRVGSPANPLFQLDNAQFWRGRGMLDLIGTTPDKFFFNNAGLQDANIQILMGVNS